MFTKIKKYVESLFSEPLVVVGQRWQHADFYNEEVNPFDIRSGNNFILTVLEVNDGWMKYRWEDGSIGSEKVSKVYYGSYILLDAGEKEQHGRYGKRSPCRDI